MRCASSKGERHPWWDATSQQDKDEATDLEGEAKHDTFMGRSSVAISSWQVLPVVQYGIERWSKIDDVLVVFYRGPKRHTSFREAIKSRIMTCGRQTH